MYPTELLRRAFGQETFGSQDAAKALAIQSPYSTLHRMKQAGVIERIGRGQYRFAPLQRMQQVAQALEQETTRPRRDEGIVELARRAWVFWLDTGRVQRLGPHKYRVRLETGQGGVRVRRR